MKTLELKDICGYLSGRILGKHPEGDICWIDLAFVAKHGIELCNYRPVLRPMSDLTKEITHRGEKFVPLDVFNDRGHFIEFDAAGLLYTVGGCMDSDWLMVFDKFHEWMFDYRGLISAGLAIDVNTLPENPYER